MVFNRFERFTSFQATPLRGGNLTLFVKNKISRVRLF